MIRLICIVVFLILYLILSIPVFLVEWLIGKFNPQARDISSLRIVQWGFKVILKMTGVKVTVYLQPLQKTDRIYCKERDGKSSPAFDLDAFCLLSFP